MVSQRSLLSGAPRLFAVFALSFILLLNLSVAAAVNDNDSGENDDRVNGISLTNADQAPECLYECDALNKYGQGALPKCVTTQLTDPKYADIVAGGSWYDLDEASSQMIQNMLGCVCTDVDFIKGLADCVFGDECGSNNTAIYDAISIGYKLCGYLYNVTFPAPTEVVKLLDITVPSGAIVPTTITGVPQATAWPGKSLSTNTASSASTPATATSVASTPSSITSNSANVTTASTNAAMKTAPSYYLAILALFAFLALFTPSVAAQNNTTAITTSRVSSRVSVTTTLPSLNGTTATTSSATVRSTTATSGSNVTTSTTRTPTASSASASSTAPSDDTGDAIKNGVSFGLVAAGALAAAFLF